MKFENTQVMNFSNALRGMRNPMNSWAKSDSYFGVFNAEWASPDYDVVEAWINKTRPDLDQETEDNFEERDKELEKWDTWLIDNGVLQKDDDFIIEAALIGPNDMDLAQRLIKAGPEHRKFLRQIFVSVDVTGPLYWWKELDTYKIGTTANSTSTMHKLASTPITLDCFETDDMPKELESWHDATTGWDFDFDKVIATQISCLEGLRQKYLETKDKRYWKELIRWLPESWLQTRTWTCNYENLRSICTQRRGHKLSEWRTFIDWVATLPYANELIFDKKPNENA